MKKIIITVLCLVAVFITGCESKEELSLVVNEEEIAPKTAAPQDINIESKALNQTEDSGLSFVVYVCGAVKNPGVYELPSKSRLFDAISAAGGYDGDAADGSLNLAKLITDEEMIYVPTLKEIEEGYSSETNSVSSTNTNSPDSNLIDINKASAADLMTLPGIGESKANLIISYRDENGPFQATSDIMLVRGIKDGLYNKVKDYICVR